MIAEVKRPDLGRLSKKVERYIETLESALAHERRRLAEKPPSDTLIGEYKSVPQYLDDGENVSFVLRPEGERGGQVIRCRTEVQANGVKALYIQALDYIAVEPASANSIRIVSTR